MSYYYSASPCCRQVPAPMQTQTPYYPGGLIPSFSSGQMTPPYSQTQMPGQMPMQMQTQMPSTQLLPATGPNAPIPTGMPTGPATTPLSSIMPEIPTTIGGTVPAQTVQNIEYIPGFLQTQIGKRVRVEFLIGTNGPMVDRLGTLLGVGASYILLQPIDTDDVLLCDIYSIKFVTFYR